AFAAILCCRWHCDGRAESGTAIRLWFGGKGRRYAWANKCWAGCSMERELQSMGNSHRLAANATPLIGKRRWHWSACVFANPWDVAFARLMVSLPADAAREWASLAAAASARAH